MFKGALKTYGAKKLKIRDQKKRYQENTDHREAGIHIDKRDF